MITAECIISYPHLFEPSENLSGVLKYSCSLLFDKKDKKGIKEIETAIAKAVSKGKSTIWGGKVPKFRYEAFRDGDAELESGEKTDAVYKGNMFLNCTSDNAPGVVGPDAKPLIDQSLIYPGCIVMADINPFPYKNGGNSGVGWGLNNIMLRKDGDRLDGRQNAADAFADHTTADESAEDELA